MPVAKDISGSRFGRLVAVKDVGKTIRGRIWECLCDCGNTTKSLSVYLTNGHKRSCGCLHHDSVKKSALLRITHGHTTIDNKKTAAEYNIWASMKARCTNPKNASYSRYGGRGITFCERWIRFENFYSDMGKRPGSSFSLDRIDTDKGYCKENCKWSDFIDQAQTRTNVRSIQFNGATLTAAAWSRKTGIPSMVIRNRIDAGWDICRVLTTPVRKLVKN